MKNCFILLLLVAATIAFAGCAMDEGPSSGGSIAPSGSSGGSIGAGH